MKSASAAYAAIKRTGVSESFVDSGVSSAMPMIISAIPLR